jgi:hypothetical protein
MAGLDPAIHATDPSLKDACVLPWMAGSEAGHDMVVLVFN